MMGEILLTGVSSKDEKTHNRLVMRCTGKLELEYKNDEAAGPNMLTGLQTNKLLYYLYTFVDNNITANQAKQIVSVLVSAGINIFVKNHKIKLRANNILYGSFILRCPTAEKKTAI